MNMNYNGRVKRELKECRREKDSLKKMGIEYGPRHPNNLSKWAMYLSILNQDSLYYGQRYEIDIELPENYPFAHPRCRFKTRIFHPNVDSTSGQICVNVINDEDCEWTLQQNIYELAIGLQALIGFPSVGPALNVDAENLLRKGDHRAYRNLARHYYSYSQQDAGTEEAPVCNQPGETPSD